MPSRRARGDQAEDSAARYLRSVGYEIRARNFSVVGGEVDIIARDPDGTVVFVEVKYRSSNRFGTAAESITDRKIERMRRAVDAYVAEHGVESYRMEALLWDAGD